MNLPNTSKLPIYHLASIFNNTSTSYKFYWFYALLQIVKKDKRDASIQELLAIILASVWYSVHFYKLSFGKQDKLAEVVQLIAKEKVEGLNLKVHTEEHIIIRQLITFIAKHPKHKISKKVLERGDYVPYRFIRPWCNELIEKNLRDGKLNRRIKEIANSNYLKLQIPYYFDDQKIVLHPDWFDYFKTHLKIMEDFCLWNLLKYLQKRNPNVPNIAGKLFSPNKKERSLTNERNYWKDIYKNTKEPFRCVFSDEIIDFENYALDHFIPWSFVTHNQLWNLVPIIPSVNSQKSNNLPKLTDYFSKFGKIQYQAVQIGLSLNKKKRLEDYLGIVGNSYEDLKLITESDFILKLENQIKPLAQIAQNMGFQTNWIYQK